jgi:prepilin-type processing-associated H-X9-DG protein
MYKIIGADQKTYGPVSADTIREWIASRRANASTQVQAEGSADWKPLSEFPEFKDALAAEPAPAQRAASVPAAPAPPPKTSGMAIASLVCGLFGCFLLPALIGLVLGIASLVKINRSQGRLGGKGVAIAGLCVSGFMLMFLPIWAALFLPALAKAKARAQTVNCVNNLKQLALAARMYANDSGDRFPYATNWCDTLQSYSGGQRIYRCPASRNTVSGYGYNAAVSGRPEADVHPATVLFFEIDGGWNVSGGPADLVQRPRHGRIVNVAFADGSVRQLHTYELQGLRWKP